MEQERKQVNLELKRISKFKRKSKLITAILCLACLFTTTSLAKQTEIPENLIEEKESSIADVMLAASSAPSVTITQRTGQVTIDWTNSVNTNEQKKIGWSDAGTYTWTAPEGVTNITLTLSGAGGGGGGSRYTSYNAADGGAGGRGNKETYDNIEVIPGETYSIVVGKGGTAGKSGNINPTGGEAGRII